ncbi:hypothetical protein V6Z12_D05G392200 [Gossypium hirsutum]
MIIYRIYRATLRKRFIESSESKVHGESWHDSMKDRNADKRADKRYSQDGKA